jgi:CheY-like chemotaxis protein
VSGTLERLYELSSLPEGTPAIVCSVPGIQQAADRLGVSDYLVKPISRDALLAALERLELKGSTVLIVDDEPDAQTLFRRMLSSAPQPYRVLRAGNGREALDLLGTERPDVILVDLVMPGMDGFRLLEAKSQDPTLCDIPAIVISARDPAGQPIVSNALAITKQGGLSMHQLLACIEAVMRILSVGEHSPVVPMPTAVPAG